MKLKPILPPRYGYVEVLDENGNHVYRRAKNITLPEEQITTDEMASYIMDGVNMTI